MMRKQLLAVLAVLVVAAGTVVYLGNRQSAEAEIAAVLGTQSDWATVDAWRLDWLDSIEAYNQINEAASLLFDDWSAGRVHLYEFRNFSKDMADAVMTHVDYFEGKVPPKGTEEAHDLFIRAFRLYSRALEKAAVFEFDAGASLLQQSADVMGEATAALARYDR